LNFGLLVSAWHQLTKLLPIELKWIVGNILLQFILEVGNEPEVIVQFDEECLVVISLPVALDAFIAVFEVAIFAEASLSCIIRFNQYLPGILLRKLEFIVFAYYLYSIRNAMSAHFLRLK
jgi:hypothetical protein